MAKIFISFLGTNNYVPCNYYLEQTPSASVTDVKYIQEALVRLKANEFSEQSKLFFFLTQDARKCNWENDQQWNRDTKQYDLPNKGLQACLKDLKEELSLKASIEDIPIPEGFSTAEIWNIFQAVFERIEEGDEIILDITHAFRSLPMLAMVLINYAKVLKRIKISDIYYGAFEKLGPAVVVKNMPSDKRNAPVLNLESFSELQDWTKAAFDFVDYGKVNALSILIKERINPILKETKGKDAFAKNLREIDKSILQLVSLITTNRGQACMEFDYDNLINRLDDFSKEKNDIKPLGAIIERLKQKLSTFKNNDTKFWLATSKWCLEHNLIQEGITQLQEGLLTWFSFYFKDKLKSNVFDWNNESGRSLISSAFTIVSKEISKDKWRGGAGRYKELTELVVEDELIKKMSVLYCDLGNIRNDINHGGYTNNQKPFKFKNKLKNYIENIESYLGNIDVVRKIGKGLLNLSNHPSHKWNAKQKQVAQQDYGEVVDIPFPHISPEINKETLANVVNEYFDKIWAIRPKAVHLMGEMTFTYALVTKLKAASIPCYASTTNRVVEEQEDGKKIVHFQFVQFRAY